ncbi:unnamed protein product [Ectocarpus fasciculatus]
MKGLREMMGWLVLLALVVPAGGVNVTSLGTKHSDISAGFRHGTPDFGCWVFTHTKKAGGSTVRSMLYKIIKHIIPPLSGYAVFDDFQWKSGQKYSEKYRRRNNTVMWGGHTEGLRRFEAPRICKWFTTFRHPVSRVVSAYLYCQRNSRDTLCASMVLKADTTDLITFAKHWGNFGLRQMSLGFIVPEEVMAAHVDDSVCTLDGENICPAWYRLKLFLQSKANETAQIEGESATTVVGGSKVYELWMHRFLRPVQEVLSSKYAAVGLVEQWDKSMNLFNKALKVPNFDWSTTSGSMGRTNANTHTEVEQAQLLSRSWWDPELRSVLWLDILLYDYAVSIFNRQIDEYGVV